MIVTIEKIPVDDPALNPWRNPIVESSRDVWIGYCDDEIAMIWGVIPGSLISECAYVWSSSTPIIRKCPKAMLKHSRAWVAELLQEFTVLTGFCERETVWLDHLGAEWTGKLGRYYEFNIRAK